MTIDRKLARPFTLVGGAIAAAVLLTLSACNRNTEPARVEPRTQSADPTAPAPVATRSDTLITGEVRTALMTDERVRGLNISVDTDRGVVRLSGEIVDPLQREQAVMIARNVDGVRDVLDEFTVRQ